MPHRIDIQSHASATQKQSRSAIASPCTQHIDGSNRRITKSCNNRRRISRQSQGRRKIIPSAARQNPNRNTVLARPLNSNCIHHRLCRPISTQGKKQPRALRHRVANARFRFRRAAGNHKLRCDLHAFKRSANSSQISPSAPRARGCIHEHNTFRFVEKFGKVTHEFVMLTNANTDVNVD
jgi:hypothetical protein